MFALREYQKQCLGAILNRYREGLRRQLVCLPTGTGKTVVFAQFPERFRMKKRMLVLAHREELLEQARDKIARVNPSLHTDIEQGARHASRDARVVVASVPTLGRAGSERIGQLDPEEFFLVVVDEAHHATAATYRRALAHFGLFDKGTQKLLVGFTATPKRGDGQGLGEVFEDIVFSRSLPDMIQAGHLCQVSGYRVESDTDISGVKSRLGDYVSSQLADAVNVPGRNGLVVKAWRELLAGRPTLCFCVNVEHAQRVAEAFRTNGVEAGSVVGDMPREERASMLAGFREGRLKVLTSCMVLTEGYDEPSVAGIILARPTRSALLYTQMVGRGTRLFPGKTDTIVVDIVDNTRAHELVTLPCLFGLPSDFDLKGHTTTKALEAFRWVEEHRPWVPLDKACSMEDLKLRCTRVELIDFETPSEIEPLTELAWTRSGKGYRLGLSGGASIEMEPTIVGKWEVVWRHDGREESIVAGPKLPVVLRSTEAFVLRRLPDEAPLVVRDSRWRARPASDRQLAWLARHKLNLPKGLTKGQASHIIGMLQGRSAVRRPEAGPGA